MNKQSYTREQVYKATLEYFGGDELATNVWIDKYCLKSDGKYFELTPDDMHRRLAKEFARIEAKYPEPMDEDEIYELLKGFKYIVPQGSPMAGIGNPFVKTSISNCFVVGGQPDSYGGIMNLDEEAVQLMKRRGGVGNSLNFLRPSGSLANGTPLGPNAGMPLYMDRYSESTREVQQDGRRGARMLSASVNHPDIDKFIDKKMIPGKVTGANVSVEVTDRFMLSLNTGVDFFQTFPVEADIMHIVKNPDFDPECPNPGWDDQSKQEVLLSLEYDILYEGVVLDGVQTYFKRVDPKKIWEKLIHNAWASAEPGCLFWDNIIKESPARGYGQDWKEISTNPCGEIPLPPYDSCRLLVLNLMGFVTNAFREDAVLEDTLLTDTVRKAQRLMDDVVDLEIEKIEAIIEDIKKKNLPEKYQEVELNLWKKILKTATEGRRTGLGITAEGDLIAAIGYKYGTPEASLFSEKLHQLIATASYRESINLAKERGHFPIWDVEKDQQSDFLERMFHENELIEDSDIDDINEYGRRNIANLTIAPTGSVSILTQTTSGIEPLFAPWYFRKKKITTEESWDYVDEVGDKWIEFPVFHRPFIGWFMAVNNLESFIKAEEILSKLDKDALQEVFMRSPYYGATSRDVDYVEKVRMQGAVQKWVDHSISVTVNMPESVTEDIVDEVYKIAYSSGCKGVTVYRDNSRGNVLSTESVKNNPAEQKFSYISAQKRPERVDCDIYHKTKSGEDFIILVGKVDDKPYEIFVIPDNEKTHFSRHIKKGRICKRKRGYYDLVKEEGNGEMLVQDITSYMIESEQNSTRNFSAMLRHGMDPRFIVDMISKYASISSFHKVVGKVLSEYTEDVDSGENCPKENCDGKIIRTDGCMKCDSCGYTVCG